MSEAEVLLVVAEVLELVYGSTSTGSQLETLFKKRIEEILSEKSLPCGSDTVQLLWEFHRAGLWTRQPQYAPGTPEWLIPRRSCTVDHCRLRLAENAVLNHFANIKLGETR